MQNPLESLEAKIEQIKEEVERIVHIAILREDAKVILSRLATLDTGRADAYLAAVREIE